MDFLNKSFAQLRDLFLSMTPAARVTAGLLLAAVMLSLVYLFTHEIAGPDVYLLSGETFSNSELNNMEKAFGQEGLDSYDTTGGRIRVPRSQRSEYLAALARHNAMPEHFGDIFTRALAAGNSFMSPSEREAYLKNAREVQLSGIISEFKEIQAATVMYDTETKPGLMREKVHSASVTVKPVGGRPLDPSLASAIRLLVVGAIAGLEPKDVAVTDFNTGRTTFGDSEGFGSPGEDPYIARKRYHEQAYKDDILEALGWIPGVTVTTHVELDPEQMHEEQEVKYDPKPVAVGSSETSSERTVNSTPPAGGPGFVAQTNSARRLAGSPANSSNQEETESVSTQQNVVSRQQITTKQAGLVPKRVTVAVTVPTSYFEQIWRRDNPTPEGEEPKRPELSDLEPIRTATIADIKQLVTTVIPQPAGVNDPTELVSVIEFPDITPPEIPLPGIGANALTWLGKYWTTLGLIGLALFSLIMLRSMIRAVPGTEIEDRASRTLPAETGEEEAESGEEAAQRKLKRFTGSGASLRDELSELVTEDPATAANILRNWIGSPS